MPYCPKCGVEVDNGIINCPLCVCDIPIFEDDIVEKRFPVPENIYSNQIKELKKQIFISITILCFGGMLTLSSVHFLAGLDSLVTNYGIVGIFGTWFYLFLFFGYIPNIYLTVICVGVVSLFLILGIDIVNPGVTWSVNVGFPVVVLFVAILLCAIKLYKRFKRKNQFVIIPIYIFTWSSVFCLGLESIIDFNFSNEISLTWSVIVLIPLLSIAAVLLGLYINVPEKIRDRLRRKFHF
ncbi:MAG: hypothetical protein GY760_18265 [Deltaproteobacteria bacterium]|nr:hypothetical protein [Deltaproteobacteria bacterium]